MTNTPATTINWPTLTDYFLSRLAERSTWTGFIALFTAAGMALRPDVAEQVATTGAAIAGLVLLLSKDKPPLSVTVNPVVKIATTESFDPVTQNLTLTLNTDARQASEEIAGLSETIYQHVASGKAIPR